MTTAGYQAELMQCPKRDVTPGAFAAEARVAGWAERTIQLFLRPPNIGEHVKVGPHALRIVEKPHAESP